MEPGIIQPTNRIYLDWAASAPLLPRVVELLAKTSAAAFGNPSSIHAEGRAAKEKLMEARLLLARACDCGPEEVVFTSGATEANAAVFGSLLRRLCPGPTRQRRPRIIASAIEHASVWEPLSIFKLMGCEVRIVPPEKNGVVSAQKIAAELSDDTALVLLMLVNNETGAVQPVAECVDLVRKFSGRSGRKIHVHTDAVQALGKTWFSFRELGADSASLSAHKLGGPRGAGALLLKRNSGFDALFPGGGQEQNRRSGTENVAAACGFTEAARIRLEAFEDNQTRARRLMAFFAEGLRDIDGVRPVPEDRRFDAEAPFSPYILCLTVPPVPGEVLVRNLDDQGIAVSSGSACHAGKKDSARVLEAQGIPHAAAKSALRVSIGPETEERDIAALLSALEETVPQLKRIAGKAH